MSRGRARVVTFYVLPSFGDRTTIRGSFDTFTDAQRYRAKLARAEGIKPVIRVAGSWPKGESAPRFL